MVRVRFAPSPTGDPHVGSAWTALFNWLYARHTNGAFVLRIEDTDRERHVPGAVDRIYELLDWLGLTPDEGPREGGPHAPYVQSQRLASYRAAADQLLASGAAYRCFCTMERLTDLRAQQRGRGEASMYDRRCRHIPAEEARQRAQTQPHVIRFAVPDGTTEACDEIRGIVRWGNATLDDTVLVKSDGFPTYHLANVVDDHAMAITHVIRAEEWLPSLPKHLLLYRAFGWEPPTFAHLPLILGPDRKKLSKRHGHTAALDFKKEGYLPEAFINFLVLLGWRPPKSDQEIFSREEIISLFDLPDIRKSGAVFDLEKLNWLNAHYLRPQASSLLQATTSTTVSNNIAQLAAERATTTVELEENYYRLNNPPSLNINLLVPEGATPKEAQRILQELSSRLSSEAIWHAGALKATLITLSDELPAMLSHIQWIFRIALSHTNPSPPGIELAIAWGRDETLKRLQEAQDALQ